MAKSIISEGKTSTEAIEKGLKELGCKMEDVDVKVLENEEKKAFFSILDPRVVKVEITVKEEIERKNTKNTKNTNTANSDNRKTPTKEDISKCKENISKFLDEFVKIYKNISYKIEEKEEMLCIEIEGEDSSKLIGYRGDTINSLQTILTAIGNKTTEINVKLSLDIGDYRRKREETLKQLSQKLERTVAKNGRKITLEPMSAYERKIIHTALQSSNKVTTYSIGEEPRRKIVVEKK